MGIALKSGQHDTDILNLEGFRKSVYSLLLATLAINIFSLALPVMTQQVYNRILPNQGTGTLYILIIGVCVALALEALLRFCRAYVIGRSGAAYEHRMACTAMNRVLNADLSKIEKCGIGEHLHRMGSVSKLKDFYSGYALTVLTDLAFVPLFLGLIIYIAHSLAIIPAIILLVFAGISFRNGYRLRQALKVREEADNTRFNFLIESLEGVHTVKAFALEKLFERRYESLEEGSTLANYRVTQETASAFNTGAIFSHLMVAGVISAGAWLVLHNQLTTGALIASLLLSGRVMQPAQKALILWARYQDYLLAKGHIQKIFMTPQQSLPKQNSTASEKKLCRKGTLSISHVFFKPYHNDKAVLEDINLQMQHGDIIAISGAHGSGKTTLLDLVAGIYPPETGDIFIDDKNTKNYSPEETFRLVGYARAKPVMFRGTIRDNITCFGQIDEASAKELSALLNVDTDVAKLPGGFDTYLNGNNTDSLSQGLKQRIAIVRALAVKPPLILFDNADRSLDKEGYVMIYSLLARLKGKATMILVTDDHNISELAERHYMLENGQLWPKENTRDRSNIHPYRELPL